MKLLEIDCCLNCPNIFSIIKKYKRIFGCQIVSKLVIDDPKGIAEWCPLPDKRPEYMKSEMQILEEKRREESS